MSRFRRHCSRQAGRTCRRLQTTHQVRARYGHTRQAALGDDETYPDVGWLWDASAKETYDKLAAIKARPKKALGQNFVKDDTVLERIVERSGVCEGDLVLEIGPGTGNLTKHLLQAGATVLAIEKDYVLADELEGVFAEWRTFRVVQGDVLRVALPDLVQQLRDFGAALDDAVTQNARVKVVANLPYYITTDLLKSVIRLGDDISDVALMLQDEVAARLTQPHPEGGAYRPMTVFCHYFSEPAYKFKVSRACYYPVPTVDGALALFRLRASTERALGARERDFLVFVRQAFNSKRKMLTNSLQPMWRRDDIVQALRDMGWPDTVRPRDLSSPDFVRLFQALCAVEGASVEAR